MVGLGSLDHTLRHLDQPEAIQLREIRLPARAIDNRLSDLLRHGVVGKTFADRDRLPQQSDGHLASQRPQPQFARTDEGVIPQRPEFLERRIPRDQQPHLPPVLNGRPQQPHQLDELLLGLRFPPDDFFEPLEFIQTEQNAIPSGPLFELLQPIPRGFQRRIPQPSERVPLLRPSLLSHRFSQIAE